VVHAVFPSPDDLDHSLAAGVTPLDLPEGLGYLGEGELLVHHGPNLAEERRGEEVCV